MAGNAGNAGAGAPKGNRNAAKAKLWEKALRRALESFTATGVKRGQALAKIAHKCIEQALAGDDRARLEIGNRLDGKAREYVEAAVTMEHRLSYADHLERESEAGTEPAETPGSSIQ
jgi:hypothetical protein